MKNVERLPKLLPWLAKKADISEARATQLWHDAKRRAELRLGKQENAEFWKLAMDGFLEGLAIESIEADSASLGLRRLARAQARWWEVPVTLFEVSNQLYWRGWQVMSRPLATHFH